MGSIGSVEVESVDVEAAVAIEVVDAVEVTSSALLSVSFWERVFWQAHRNVVRTSNTGIAVCNLIVSTSISHVYFHGYFIHGFYHIILNLSSAFKKVRLYGEKRLVKQAVATRLSLQQSFKYAYVRIFFPKRKKQRCDIHTAAFTSAYS